ncbi:organic hydroperoxide resistance protein [Actinacidiphila yeochonensis]|uniref:organic hydroperoxide resistance protein n=1 Tax=Actinacidiphila yeochonensis TaxID=89050 RepID=UPI000567E4AE|nr:organic hydroperoxide resistance protein [Actinacidiphila yeochonensis]
MAPQTVDVLYTAVATAENGRDGRVSSDDGRLDVVVNPPREMGGSGAGTNPEQLFAAGYGACFQSALGAVARGTGVDVAGSRVTAKVGIGPISGGYGLAVELVVSIPGADAATARELVEKAHQVCPYSNATRGNIEVTLTVA